jgi:hypothetical protein
MSGLDIIILIIAIVMIAGVLGAFLSRDQKTLVEITKDHYENEEIQDIVEVVTKEIIEPKKKRKYYPKKPKTSI